MERKHFFCFLTFLVLLIARIQGYNNFFNNLSLFKAINVTLKVTNINRSVTYSPLQRLSLI